MLDYLVGQLSASGVPVVVVALAVIGIGTLAFAVSLGLWRVLFAAASAFERGARRRSIRQQRDGAR